MDLSNDLISKFVKITNDTDKQKSKEGTVYGTAVKYDGGIYVKIDGSDLLTPVDTTADIKEGERVTITIKDHNATVTGNITSPSASSADVKKVTKNVEEIEGEITEFEAIIADVVHVGELDAEVARIDELIAGKATIEDLTATNAEITNLKAKDAEIENLVADKATIEDLTATNAEITNLKADKADITYLDANFATIDELEATHANIEVLDAEVASINTLVNGNLTSDNILSFNITSKNTTMEDAFIKDAMIDRITANKIMSGTIDTNNVVIQSTDGSMLLQGNILQMKDESGKVRIQIGKDNGGNFTFVLYDKTGKGVLIDEEGIKSSDAIADGLIVDAKVADNANISGSKLDIASVITEVNKDNSTTIKSSKIYLNEQNQSLEVAFNSLKSQVETIQDVTIDGDLSSIIEQVQSNTTKIEANKEGINTLVAENVIRTEEISDLEGELQQVNTTLSNKYASLEQNLDGFKTTVSDTYTTKTEFQNLEVGSTNLVAGTKDFSSGWWYDSAYMSKANDTAIDSRFTGISISFVPSTAGKDYCDLTKNKSVWVEPDTEYTLSFWAKGSGKFYTYLYGISASNGTVASHYNSSGYSGTHSDGASIHTLSSNDTYKRYWVVYRTNSTAQGAANLIAARAAKNLNTNVNMIIYGVKFEKGNKPTDWSPAPEDVQANIDAVDGKFANYSTTTQMNSAIQQKANEITSSVSSTYTTKTEFQNLEVGGRNLISRSTEAKEYCVGTDGAPMPYTGNAISDYISVLPDTIYTFTKTNTAITDGYFRISWHDENKTFISREAFADNEARRKSPTNAHFIRVSYPIDSLPKLEKGNKATDWTPAPEDVQANIDAVDGKFANYSTTTQMNSAIQQKANEITSSVSSTYTTKTEFQNLKVGSTNLLVGSSDVSKFTDYWVNTGCSILDSYYKGSRIYKVAFAWNDYGFKLSSLPNVLATGKRYTYSVYVKSSSSSYLPDIFVYGGGWNAKLGTATTSWQRLTFKGTFSDLNGMLRIEPTTTSSDSANQYLMVVGMQLEEGEVLTDYSPAPEDVQENIDNLEVGGRNYLTEVKRLGIKILTAGTGSDPYMSANHDECPHGYYLIGAKDGKTSFRIPNVITSNGVWTVSFELKGSQSTPVGFTMDICDSGATKFLSTADNKWTKHSLTVNVTNYSADVFNFIDLQSVYWAYIFIRNMKVEKGSKATDWTPAPEDVQANIDAVDNKFANYSTTTQMNSAIQQKANEITSSVSSTYTTKTEFQNLAIGGRNLIKQSNVANRNATSASYDKNTATWTLTANAGTGDSWGAGLILTGNNVRIPYGKTYVLSFEIKVPRACSWTIDVNNYAVTGSNWNGNDNDNGSARATSSNSLIANQWIKCWSRISNTASGNTNKVDIYDNSNFGVVMLKETSSMTYQIRNIQGEIGNIPSEYTPAPEDVQSNIDAVDGKFANYSTTSLAKAMSNGKMLYTDPMFKKDVNAVYVYNNSGNGTVTRTRILKVSDCPTTSTHCIEIKTTGTASPGNGGFYQSIQSRANAIFIQKILAKVPTGCSLNLASNSMGDGYTDKWLTSNKGTGKWEEYIREVRCGSTGTFAGGGHVYVSGASPTTSSPLVWYVGMCTVYDITDSDERITDLTTRVSTAESKLTKDSLTTTIGSYYTTSTDVNNAITSKGYATTSQVQQTKNELTATFKESGGYNRVRNGAFLTGDLTHWSDWGSCTKSVGDSTTSGLGKCLTMTTTGTNQGIQQIVTGLVTGKKYILSALVHAGSGVGALQVYDGSSYPSAVTTSTGKYERLSVPFTANTTSVTVYLGRNAHGSNGTYYYTGVMLEEGTTETPWSPHPDEVYAGMTRIDKDGVKVKHSSFTGHTHLAASGFYLNHNGADVVVLNSSGLMVKGTVTATAGKIAGYTINGNTLVGNQVGMSGTTGEGWAFWAGSNTSGSAPFRVGHAGELYATNANITGTINATSGTFSGNIVTNNIVKAYNSVYAGSEIWGGYKLDSSGSYVSTQTFTIHGSAAVQIDGNPTRISSVTGEVKIGDASSYDNLRARCLYAQEIVYTDDIRARTTGGALLMENISMRATNAYVQFTSGLGVVRVKERNHLYLQTGGNTGGDTSAEIRCTRYADASNYVNIRAYNVCAQNAVYANGVNVSSDINRKRDIELYSTDALQEVCSTPVYAYHLDTDKDEELKRIGIIMQEAPLDAIDLTGKGVDLYQMVTMLWKATQQQQEMIEELKQQLKGE